MYPLETKWWIELSDLDAIKKALVRSTVDGWMEEVTSALRENRSSKKHPATWEELGHLFRKDHRNLYRWLTGKSLMRVIDGLHLSTVVGRSIFPAIEMWLARVTRRVCQHEDVSFDIAKVYAAYCLRNPVYNGETLDPECVSQAAESVGCDHHEAARSIAHVATLLTERLGRREN